MARHSVRRHLRVEIEAYDEAIRRFIPGYEAMLEAAAREVARTRPRRVLDLGAGTGALSEAVLLAAEPEEIVLLDADPEMLAQARVRLSRFGARVTELEGTFDDPLPACDAVVASLALHHVPTLEEKRALFRRIADRLPPGGVFVNADATMPSDPGAREAEYRGWAAHLASAGISEEQAYRHFAEWAEEDTYFPREAERGALLAAGFEVSWPWTEGPMLVAAARKPAGPGGRPGRSGSRRADLTPAPPQQGGLSRAGSEGWGRGARNRSPAPVPQRGSRYWRSIVVSSASAASAAARPGRSGPRSGVASNCR